MIRSSFLWRADDISHPRRLSFRSTLRRIHNGILPMPLKIIASPRIKYERSFPHRRRHGFRKIRQRRFENIVVIEVNWNGQLRLDGFDQL
jgi:hypothetical protein